MKKAQAQIITVILIILLVLAATVIVWQVVSNTISQGAKEIEDQSSCINLRIDITNINTVTNEITIRPTKNISGYRAYVEGVEFGDEGEPLNSLRTATITDSDTTKLISPGDEIEIIGKIGSVLCTGTKKTA